MYVKCPVARQVCADVCEVSCGLVILSLSMAEATFLIKPPQPSGNPYYTKLHRTGLTLLYESFAMTPCL